MAKAKRKKSLALQKISAIPGMLAKIAKTLRVSRQAVSAWNEVPINRIAQVERITGIHRSELRTDIFG